MDVERLALCLPDAPQARVPGLVDPGLDRQHGRQLNVGQLLDAALEFAVDARDARLAVEVEVVDDGGPLEVEGLGERDAGRAEGVVAGLDAREHEVGLFLAGDGSEETCLRPGVEHVRRELEGGVEELTDVELPAVFTIQTGINEPRYASLRGIRQAQSKPLEAKSLADLGLGAEDLAFSLSVESLYEPETESDVTLFEGDADETAGELADLLRDMGVDA